MFREQLGSVYNQEDILMEELTLLVYLRYGGGCAIMYRYAKESWNSVKSPGTNPK